MNRATSATGWVRNPDGTLGWTWNPITGCLNHTSDGLCLGGMFPCYAYNLANGRLRQRYLANENTIMRFSDGYAPMKLKVTDPFYPRLWVERFDLVSLVRSKPRGIFVCDMGELFGDWIPEEWTRKVLINIEHFSQHRFYLLTKQPQNLPQWSPFPDNCWVGGTVTNNDLWRRVIYRLGYLTQAKVKFISFEPLLERICLPPLPFTMIKGTRLIDWVIIGAQTKPTVYPKIEWVEEIVRACDKAGVPVFLKDNLKLLIQEAGMGKAGWAAREWVQCKYPILRQELPK